MWLLSNSLRTENIQSVTLNLLEHNIYTIRNLKNINNQYINVILSVINIVIKSAAAQTFRPDHQINSVSVDPLVVKVKPSVSESLFFSSFSMQISVVGSFPESCRDKTPWDQDRLGARPLLHLPNSICKFSQTGESVSKDQDVLVPDRWGWWL